MSIAAIVASCAAAAITIAVVVLMMRHCDKAPQKTHPWLRRINILLMWCAGAVIAAAGAAGLASRLTAEVTRLVGAQYAPIVTTTVIIAALVFTVGTLAALIWAPDDQAAFSALAVPLVLGLVAGGVLHEIYAATIAPGQAVTSAISAWLAG